MLKANSSCFPHKRRKPQRETPHSLASRTHRSDTLEIPNHQGSKESNVSYLGLCMCTSLPGCHRACIFFASAVFQITVKGFSESSAPKWGMGMELATEIGWVLSTRATLHSATGSTEESVGGNKQPHPSPQGRDSDRKCRKALGFLKDLVRSSFQ